MPSNPRPPIEDRADRFAPLDGLRGCAILLVLCVHAFRYRGGAAVGSALRELTRCGWVGVVLFFVLSGFLITGVLIDTRNRPRSLLDFYARRSLRILPLFLVFVSAYLWLVPLLPTAAARLPQPDAASRPFYVLQMANMVEWLAPGSPGVPPLAPLWSLAVEEQVYLVWPIVIALVPNRRLGGVLIGAIAASFAWRVGCRVGGYTITTAYAAAPSAVEAFAAGGLVAWLWRVEGGPRRIARWAPRGLAASGAGLAAMAAGLGHFRFWVEPTPILTVGLSLLATFFACLIGTSLTSGEESPLNRRLSAGWLRSFGRYSYAIYLLHEPIAALIRPEFDAPSHGLERLGNLPLAFVRFGVVVGLSYVAARISWTLIEEPCLRLKRWFPVTGDGARPKAADAGAYAPIRRRPLFTPTYAEASAQSKPRKPMIPFR